jgi:dihydrofolate reductase
MRLLRYCVASSLDGFIAGPNGEYDWIRPDAGIDFASLHRQFDTLLMGRRTYEVASTRADLLKSMGKRIIVVSTTLKDTGKDASNDTGQGQISILSDNLCDAITALKSEPGKDIWLMGGGVLFRTLLDFSLVDSVEVSVFPILLGAGTPLIPAGKRASLKLDHCNELLSGVLMLSYSISKAEPERNYGKRSSQSEPRSLAKSS